MKPLAPLACAALVGASIAAQAPAPAPAAQPPARQPSFRTGAVVVEVDAIVTDRSGRFVPALTANDFEVLEDGKPQRIAHIYAVTGAAVTAAPAAPDLEAPSTAAAPRTVPGRVFVLLFDQEHMQEGAFKRLRDAAITFLTSEFKPGDVGGIVVGNTMAGNQLTSDREALLAAVRAAKPDFSKTSRRLELLEWPRFQSEAEAVRIALANDRDVLAQVVRRACDDDSNACKNYDPEPLVRGKAQTIVGEIRPPAMRTVRTLQALASGLARLPGRKTIILMTDGFFVEESWADLRQIVGAAARSNVRIYSLDARGLQTRQANDPRQMSVMDPGGRAPLGAYNTLEDGPNVLAADTGGYPIRNTNKFADALGEIARDTSNYYVIGYTPANGLMDGSFRKITVRVKRPDLKVRARRGYQATSRGMAQAADGPREAAATVLAAPPAVAVSGMAPAAAPVSAPVAREAAEGAAVSSAPSPGVASTTAIALRPDSNTRIHELATREKGAGGDDSFASQGWDRYRKGDLEGAAKLFEKAAAHPDTRPWVRYALGYTELGLRHLERAAQEWEKVRDAVPEFQPVYLDLADVYLQMEQYSRGIGVLRAADARWPGEVDVLNAMGTIQVRRGALDDAIRTFKAAVEAKSGDALAYFNLGRTYELRYLKTRRYLQTESRWVINRADVQKAVASYEQYVKLGGPYAAQARQALQNLQWLQ